MKWWLVVYHRFALYCGKVRRALWLGKARGTFAAARATSLDCSKFYKEQEYCNMSFRNHTRDAFVDRALRLATSMGLKIEEWNKKFGVTLQKRDAKGLRTLLFFFLGKICGTNSREMKDLEGRYKLSADRKSEQEAVKGTLEILDKLYTKFPMLNNEKMRKSDLQTCNGRFPRVLLVTAHAAAERYHAKHILPGLGARGVPLPAHPLSEGRVSALSEAETRSLRLQAQAKTEIQRHERMIRLDARAADETLAAHMVQSLREAQRKQQEVRARLRGLDPVSTHLEGQRRMRMQRLAEKWALLEERRAATTPAVDGVVRWALDKSDHPSKITVESLQQQLSTTGATMSRSSLGEDVVDVAQLIRQATHGLSKCLRNLDDEAVAENNLALVSSEVRSQARRLLQEHGQHAGNFTKLNTTASEKAGQANIAIQGNAARSGVIRESGAQGDGALTPTGRNAMFASVASEFGSPTDVTSATGGQLLPPTPKPYLSTADLRNEVSPAVTGVLGAPTSLGKRTPLMSPLTPLSTSKVLLSVRRNAFRDSATREQSSKAFGGIDINKKLFADEGNAPLARTLSFQSPLAGAAKRNNVPVSENLANNSRPARSNVPHWAR